MQFHASNEQLIKFRDKAVLELQIKQHIENCSLCLSEISILENLRENLMTFDAPTLSSEEFDLSWETIKSSISATKKPSKKPYWFAAVASVVVAVLLVTYSVENDLPEQQLAEIENEKLPHDSPVIVKSKSNSDSINQRQLDQLLEYSRLLESRLQAMPQPTLVRASTAGTITQLEDQISMLDTRLSMQDQAPLSEQQRHVLWQQRVNSMNNLYRVRATQLQRVSY